MPVLEAYGAPTAGTGKKSLAARSGREQRL